MFRFANPIYLYLLGLIVIFALLHYVTMYHRRKRIARYGDPALVKKLFVDVSVLRPELKLWLCLLAFAMFVLALARPQNGTKQAERERYGIEAMVALDVSNSMMAQDVHPSRLDKSKRLVSNMMNEMTDDQIGLVTFAGEAFIQLPITSDFVSAKMFLDQINPGMIDLQGTDIARAIDLCQRSFTQREDVNRAIFIITDGEDNEGGAVEAAKEAAKKGVHVFVLGVGSPQGAHIPIPGSTQYMIDENGDYVTSKLNEKMCQEIAAAGEGAYIYVDNSSSAQDALNKHIDQLAKTKLDAVSYSEYNEKYQLFLLIGVVLLILDVLILARENHLFAKVHLFKDKSLVLFLLGLLAMSSCTHNSTRDFIRRGNRYFRQAQADTTALDNAVTEYQKALSVDSMCARAHYNQGDALLYQGKDSTSLVEFKAAQRCEQNPARLAHICHNMGVIMQTAKQFAPAIECYKEALRNNPNDDETRYNLALCQWQLKNQDQDGNGGGGGGGNDGNDQQQDQNGDNQQNQDQQNKDQQGQGQQDNQDEQQNKGQQDQQDQSEQKQEQPKQNELSKEAAEQMLNAAMQNERATQDRLNRYNQRKEEQEKNPSQRRLQKNW